MGHLINPTGFRLQFFGNWKDIWAVSNGFVYANVLNFLLDIKLILRYFFENWGTDDYTFLYSHFTAENSVNFGFFIKLYFYDGFSEFKFEKFKRLFANFFKKQNKFYEKIFIYNYTFTLNREKINFLTKLKFYDYLFAYNLIFFFVYSFKFSSGFNSEYFLFLKRLFFFFKNNFQFFWNFFVLKKKNSNLSTLTFIKFFIKKLLINNVNLQDMRYFSRRKLTFKFFFEFFTKIYFNWFKYRLVLKKLIKLDYFFKTGKFFLNYNIFLIFSSIIESIFLSLYRLYISNKRYSKIFFVLMSYIKPSLNKLSKSKFVVQFFGISNDNVTAVFVSHYIARKLEYRFTIKELFKPIGRDLRHIMTNNSILFGYKIKFIGRLTRRDRVRYSISSSGDMPLSTMHAQIEHAFSLGYLKNGVCSLRIWFYRHKSFGNHNYNFSYKVNVS